MERRDSSHKDIKLSIFSSYLPNSLLRQIEVDPSPPKAPQINLYHAAVAFIDISGKFLIE
jgi:hypothetical protein